MIASHARAERARKSRPDPAEAPLLTSAQPCQAPPHQPISEWPRAVHAAAPVPNITDSEIRAP
ncbi:hypothetical protein, partial [Brevifollis gellanilyticus]|uniref:hypothetical protein n=1 Tax=Brevifollis gellanilyticus TaxID=748831 RepID=UPI001C3F95E2